TESSHAFFLAVRPAADRRLDRRRSPDLPRLVAREHDLDRAGTPSDEPTRDVARTRRTDPVDQAARPFQSRSTRLWAAARRVLAPTRRRLDRGLRAHDPARRAPAAPGHPRNAHGDDD